MKIYVPMPENKSENEIQTYVLGTFVSKYNWNFCGFVELQDSPSTKIKVAILEKSDPIY